MSDQVRTGGNEAAEMWPELPLAAWQETYATLHMWTQVVGKIKLALAPPLNHSWHVTLHLTCRGLTTGPIPHDGSHFEIEFDFLEHRLLLRTSAGARRSLPLSPRPVSDFYRNIVATLHELGIDTPIWTSPVEVADPVPFERDTLHAAYDPDYAQRCWRILLQSYRALSRFRGEFIGKASPIHFFWGSFDLAVSRFSGRTAPPHPGGIPNLPDCVTREAYSHEVSSAGFWPGGGPVPMPVFYSYAYPEPTGYRDYAIRPREAFYSPELREFLLPYDIVRTAAAPDDVLMEFLQSTYAAAADLGRWDRTALERRSHLSGTV